MGAAVLARDQSMFENLEVYLEVYQFRNSGMSSGNIVRGLGQCKQYKQINKDTNRICQSFSAVNGNEGVHLFKS